MQFEYTEPQSELEILMGGFVSINIIGPIEVGDDEKFLTFLEKVAPPRRTTIYINSVGGNVEAAMGIGRLIRAGWYSTSIGPYLVSSSSRDSYIFPRELKPGNA